MKLVLFYLFLCFNNNVVDALRAATLPPRRRIVNGTQLNQTTPIPDDTHHTDHPESDHTLLIFVLGLVISILVVLLVLVILWHRQKMTLQDAKEDAKKLHRSIVNEQALLRAKRIPKRKTRSRETTTKTRTTEENTREPTTDDNKEAARLNKKVVAKNKEKEEETTKEPETDERAEKKKKSVKEDRSKIEEESRDPGEE